MGLGLSICKNLIENMAGSVNVVSKLGEGTTFTISFKTTCIVTDAQELEEAKSVSSHVKSDKVAEQVDEQIQKWDITKSLSECVDYFGK